MKKHRIWYMVVLVMGMLMYIMANQREPLVFLCGMIVVPVLTLVIQKRAMQGAEEEYRIRSGCRVGKKVPLEIVIERRSRMPLGPVKVYVRVSNLLYGEEEHFVIALQPAEKKRMEYAYRIKMEDCGNVRVFIEKIEYYDLLGLFRWKHNRTQEMEVLVYPAEMQMNPQLERRPETRNSGEMYDQMKTGQDVSEVAELREYVEGDSQKSIHWKLSTKLDRLIVREFGYPADYSTLILCDIGKEMYGQKIENLRNNAVLAITVSLSESLLQINLEHNVGRFCAGEYINIPVYSQGTHEQMVFNLLCQPLDGRAETDAAYQILRENLKNEYTKIIYITSEYDEESARQLARDVDLTVIRVGTEKNGEYVDAQGYSVIPVEAGYCADRVQNIVI